MPLFTDAMVERINATAMLCDLQDDLRVELHSAASDSQEAKSARITDLCERIENLRAKYPHLRPYIATK